MASKLNQEDVAKLLAEPSPTVRAEVAGKLGSEIDNPALTAHELELAQDIVRAMARDVEVAVRASLSQSLRRAERLPHDVAVRLAQDVDAVSLPILAHSTVLTDDDLTAIVSAGSTSKQEIIAARPHVSEKVADSLISVAGEKVVATLMGNAGARINEGSLQKAVDRFSTSDTVKEKMVHRASLPPAITERLVDIVSNNLKNYLVQHHDMKPGMATDIVMQSRERAIIGMSSGTSEAELEKLVAQMYHNRRLTPSLVLRALCMGDIAFFESSIACMANVPVVNARILIHDGGRLGLKSIYDKAALPPRLLPAIRVAIDVIHETPLDGGDKDRERFRSRVIERILTQCDDLVPEDLDYLLDKLGSGRVATT